MKMAKNMSQRWLAKELEISRSGVLEILSKFQGTRNVSDSLKCSRRQKLLHGIVRKLIKTAKVQPKKTARQAMDECD